MIGITITITDQLKHDLWAVITGQDTTGVSASKTYPGWKQGTTGSFHDTNLRAGSANAGAIVTGDGSIQITDEGISAGQTTFFPGKMSYVGFYFLSSTATALAPEVLRVEFAGGGIG